MPIVMQNPVTTLYPEIPYDQLLVALSVAPRIVDEGTRVEGSYALRVTPYRVLPNGIVDAREDKAWSESNSAMFEAATEDPALAAAMTTILGAIQTFLIARGV